MTEKQKENRTNLEDLPQAEREVNPKEAKEVRGGIELENVMVTSWATHGSDGGGTASRPVKGEGDLLIAGTASSGHVK